MKPRSGYIPRYTPLARGGPIARSGRPKRVNRKRKASEWKRAYGSKARVRWLKAQPCAADGRMPCDVAHISSGGAGRKADHDQTIPLCSGINGCHAKQHQSGWMSIGLTEEGRRRAAENTELAWVASQQAREGGEP